MTTSPFQQALADGLAAIRQVAGVAVEYDRDGQRIPLVAVVSDLRLEVVDDYGVTQRVPRREYLVAAADLPFEPDRGDRIRETHGSNVLVYEVMGPGGSEPDWRFSDPSHSTIRIHTAHVATEVVDE